MKKIIIFVLVSLLIIGNVFANNLENLEDQVTSINQELDLSENKIGELTQNAETISEKISEIEALQIQLELEKSALVNQYSQNELELKDIMLKRISYKNSLSKIELQLSEEKENEKACEIFEIESNVLASANIENPPEHEILEPLWPVPDFGEDWITSYWGDGRGHKGLDIAANFGEEVVASESGYIEEVFASSSWGNNILISHNENYKTRYAHLSDFAVKQGDYVEKGQVVGYIGSTGNSTGNHLHYEIYFLGERVDPYPYLKP